MAGLPPILDPALLETAKPLQGPAPSSPSRLEGHRPTKIARVSRGVPDVATQAARYQRQMERRTRFEESLRRTERVLRDLLARHVRSHPFLRFARYVNGSLGQGAKVTDQTLLFNTTEAKRAIEDIIADLQLAFNQREQIAREIEEENEGADQRKPQFLEELRLVQEALNKAALNEQRLRQLQATAAYRSVNLFVVSAFRSERLEPKWNLLQAGLYFQKTAIEGVGTLVTPRSSLGTYVGNQQNALRADLLRSPELFALSMSSLASDDASLALVDVSDEPITKFTAYALNLLRL